MFKNSITLSGCFILATTIMIIWVLDFL